MFNDENLVFKHDILYIFLITFEAFSQDKLM